MTPSMRRSPEPHCAGEKTFDISRTSFALAGTSNVARLPAPRAKDVAVSHETQVGVAHRFPADLFGPREEALAHEVEHRALGYDRTAEIGVRPLAALDHGGKQTAQLLESAAIGHREIALGRQVVGDEDVVAV